jgi:PKD repeat protein
MADSNRAALAPVAKVWRHLRTTQPGINLYDVDESHPAAAGSYAAACTFYAILFQKNPALCTYNFSLPGVTAGIIRNAAKNVAFDSLSVWNRALPVPVAAFSYSVSGKSASFSNASQGAGQFRWHFGDGDSSQQQSPVHLYTGSGVYQVRLIAGKCGDADTMIKAVTIQAAGIGNPANDTAIALFPVPAGEVLHISTRLAADRIDLIHPANGVYQSVTPRHTGPYSLDIGDLPPGSYVLRFISKEGICYRPFSKL